MIISSYSCSSMFPVLIPPSSHRPSTYTCAPFRPPVRLVLWVRVCACVRPRLLPVLLHGRCSPHLTRSPCRHHVVVSSPSICAPPSLVPISDSLRRGASYHFAFLDWWTGEPRHLCRRRSRSKCQPSSYSHSATTTIVIATADFSHEGRWRFSFPSLEPQARGSGW